MTRSILSQLLLLCLFPCIFPGQTQAGERANFNGQFLRLGSKSTTSAELDTQQFSNGNPLTAGEYPSDIYINEQLVAHNTIRLATPDQGKPVGLCLTTSLLTQAHYNQQALPDSLVARLSNNDECVTTEDLDPEVSWKYDLNAMTLHLDIPQGKLEHKARGEIAPEQWNWGENVAYVNYNANLYGSNNNDQHYSSSYLGLQTGLNLGAWRLRHQSSLQQSDGQQSWQSISTYGERSLPAWHSRLRLGQGWTSGALFDSIGYQGINLASDERMLPESQRGYAPTVFGIARTYAHVKIEQNGYLLYETTVSPGSFAIDDLYPTGYGGDLKVTITESDGSSQSYTVPFATTPGMVRAGSTLYSATMGEVRDSQLHGNKPLLGQLTLQQGINNLFSVYTGVSLLPDYSALLLGAGLNTRYGSLSIDVTRSNLQSEQQTQKGQSWRATYSKQFATTHTNLSLASYRYSSEGYRSLHEGVLASTKPNDIASSSHHPAQQRFDLTVNQPIGDGSLYLMGSRTSYWDSTPQDTSWQLGYSNRVGKVNYQISGQRLQESDGHHDTQIALSLSMPLGEHSNHSLNLQLSQSQDHGSQLQGSLGGSLGEKSEYSYGLTASQDLPKEGEQTTSLGTNGSYRSQIATFSGSYSRDNHGQQQYGVSMQGALLAHDGAIIAQPHLGETFAIIEAPAAAGASIKGHPDIVINEDGYAVLPDLTPYSQNPIELDPEGMATNTELMATNQWVVPDAGAAAKVKFTTQSGQAVLLTLKNADHHAIPFGARALDENGQQVGLVGQGGQLYARLNQPKGKLQLTWSQHNCHVDYQLPSNQTALLQLTHSLICQP